MLLDDVLAAYEFGERHERRIAAPPQRVRAALRELTPRDVWITRALLAIRVLPRALRRSAPSLATDRALLDFMDEYGFTLLAESDEEIVYGIVDRFWRLRTSPVRLAGLDDFAAFDTPGFAKAAFNFVFLPESGGTRVVTETRIHALGDDARRSFGRYWLLIRAGSGLTRRDLLAALARRAEV
jgi:hypothetical protein